MNKIRLCDLLRGTDINPPGHLDRNKELSISEWGEEDGDTLLIITKRAKGERRENYYRTNAYAVICERDDGYGIDSAKIMYTENARRTLAICYYNLYGIDSEKTKLVAVTGTNGKTTVASILHYILRFSGEDAGFIGTGSILINDTEVSDRYYSMTTPDPKELYRQISDMQKLGCGYIVLEASSHAIALEKLYPLYFDVGIFTNLSAEHRDFHKDMQDYFDVKLSLFERCKLGIFNLDCPYSRRAYELAKCEKTSVGIINTGDAYASDIHIKGLRGSSFFYREEGLIFGVDLSLVGAFNVYNSLLALRAAIKLGIRPCVAKRAINCLSGIAGRMEIIEDDVLVIIDYAHTPFAVENTLKTLFSAKRKRQSLFLVIGCGGEREHKKRREIGRIAEKYCERIYLTEDNSRGEKTENIIADISGGITDSQSVTVLPDRAGAIRKAISDARTGDVIAILGKGREGYMIDQNGYRDFSDKSEAQHALRLRKAKNENNT